MPTRAKSADHLRRSLPPSLWESGVVDGRAPWFGGRFPRVLGERGAVALRMRAGGPHVASVVHRQGLLAPALGAIEQIAVAAFIVRQVVMINGLSRRLITYNELYTLR